MKKLVVFFFLVAAAHQSSAQEINPKNIQIARDKWGVPHIFAKTDAEVAYGLAWAHAEDDFATIQTSYLAGKGMLGLLKGKKGAQIDYVAQLFRTKELVEARYQKDISPQFKSVLLGYAQGFNAYAKAHKKQVLVPALFPVTPKDMLAFSVLQLAISSGADQALKAIFDGKVATMDFLKPGGSNAFAFNSAKTTDGSVYLAINAHQPLEGPVAFYEAQLCSEEGWNILGALFPGAPSILHGVNENLGWAHTVNYPDKLDTYQLEINPQNPKQYKFDGQWVNLEEKKIPLKINLGGIVPITVQKAAYWSKYGPTVISKKGTFSIRTGALDEIRALEQWYTMNKATNFTEFNKALQMGAISGYNIVYADKRDTIFYLSNGKLPLRDSSYNWKGTLPGNTSKTLWTNYHKVSELPQVLKPTAGYVFNTNHSPFNSTAAAENISAKNYDKTMGYETWENNRSVRFMEQVAAKDKFTFEEFKRIKFDRQLPQKLAFYTNIDSLFLLDEAKNPEIADVLRILKTWDRKADTTSIGASIFSQTYYIIDAKLKSQGRFFGTYTAAECKQALVESKAYFNKYFSSVNVPFANYQRLIRGKVSMAVGGMPDVLAATHAEPYKNGQIKDMQGDAYIELVHFAKDGPEIESVNCYGASADPKSVHYTDQMPLFVKQQTKKMTLNKTEVLRTAERIYHPQ
ncbi:MAG: penicillin acylase family protein [Sphingobacteriaceae bacterium]